MCQIDFFTASVSAKSLSYLKMFPSNTLLLGVLAIMAMILLQEANTESQFGRGGKILHI